MDLQVRYENVLNSSSSTPTSFSSDPLIKCHVCSKSKVESISSSSILTMPLSCLGEKSHNYTCPKCNMRYCGLECYKKHNSSCVSSFHNTNLSNALKGEKASESEQQRMNAILQRQMLRQREEEEEEAAQQDEESGSEVSEGEELELEEALKMMHMDDFDPTMLPERLKIAFQKDVAKAQKGQRNDDWAKMARDVMNERDK